MFAVGAISAASAALADNPLGAYVGAGVGGSNVGNSDYDYGYYGGYHDDDVAWKAIVGIRPIPFVGAEAEWIDFGSGHGDNGYFGYGDYYANSTSHPKAAALYGVGYLPLPLPFLDVYGKAGVARLQTDLTTYQYTSGGYCPPPYTTATLRWPIASISGTPNLHGVREWERTGRISAFVRNMSASNPTTATPRRSR